MFVYEKSIDSFFNWVFMREDKTKFYFHNLKFDLEFALYYLYENGFEHTEERKLCNKQFSTVISDMGVFYACTIKMYDKTFHFYDSLKLLPFRVKELSKAFDIKQLKGVIDYDMFRAVGYEPTEDEVAYLRNDCIIVGKSLRYFFDQDLNKMTIASNAMSCYKKSIGGGQKFRQYFPVLEMDAELRQSYKGGWTFANPKFQNQEVGEGVVLDINSEYPYVMNDMMLPYGEPIFYEGEYVHDNMFPLYIQTFRCSFELKEGHLPMLQLKNNSRFVETQYLTSSDNFEETLCMTSVEMKLFFDHYNVYNLEYFRGWKFRQTDKLFKDYIAKWMTLKEEATITKNMGLRTLAKLLLNSLYGKFGLNPVMKSKYPEFIDGMVKYTVSEEKEREPIYIPVASFITAYARDMTIRSAQANYDRFIYADTDSIHLLGTEVPKNLRVHESALGAWDKEAVFRKGKFLRAKTYIEEHRISQEKYSKGVKKDEDNALWWYSDIEDKQCYKMSVTVAGLPENCRHELNFDNFEAGFSVGGKLQQKRVKGGVVLFETDFTIKI